MGRQVNTPFNNNRNPKDSSKFHPEAGHTPDLIFNRLLRKTFNKVRFQDMIQLQINAAKALGATHG